MSAHLTVPADTQHLAELGAFVQAQCARHPNAMLIDLVVTELAVNAIRHGGASTLRVTVSDDGAGYTLVFEDDGRPFDPLAAEPRATGELREGGYGLTLIRTIAQAAQYTHANGLNQLHLTFTGGTP